MRTLPGMEAFYVGGRRMKRDLIKLLIALGELGAGILGILFVIWLLRSMGL